MPNIDTMRESNFLKKEDCGDGILVTIASISQENVAPEDKPAEMKWCLYIRESEKPMTLNSTNMQLIAQITGSKETDDWAGKKIVLYNDPSVSFGGKLTGGIRVRAPKGQGPRPNPKFQQEPDFDEEPPF